MALVLGNANPDRTDGKGIAKGAISGGEAACFLTTR
jgi:hypothetical protein